MKISRKEFIKKAAMLSVIGAGSATFLSACGEGNKDNEPAKSDPCNDLSNLSADEKETRAQTVENFEYVAETPKPQQRCDNCSLWIEAKEGEKCGGCQIIPGPINPAGHCNQWIEG